MNFQKWFAMVALLGACLLSCIPVLGDDHEVNVCVRMQEVSDMGLVDHETSSCRWVSTETWWATARKAGVQHLYGGYFIGSVSNVSGIPNPWPPWYENENQKCKGDWCYVEAQPFGERDIGEPCSKAGSNGFGHPGVLKMRRVKGPHNIDRITCLFDTDEDGIPDDKDDCPFDATNTNPDCMNDLADCNQIVGHLIDFVGLTGGAVGAYGAYTMTKQAVATAIATMAASGGTSAAAGTAAAAAAGVSAGVVFYTGVGMISVAAAGSAYCLISELEN